MRIRHLGTMALAAASAAAAATSIIPAPAQACGGFFCSAANPVNQAAEQIIFSDNGDGSITAVIQIMYEGPSSKFAWLLPVPGVPDVEVSSDQALDRLNQATNPLYQLNTVFEGDCNFGFANGGPAAMPTVAGDAAAEGPGGVMVLAEKQVGPYQSVTISVDPTTDDAAQEAVDWLTDNGYDVTGVGADVLRPYLEEGLNLVAFRLTKGNTSGSIRPVMITYESELPSIPIRPTAVAASADMGVKVWVLSGDRAIPKNYKGLVLNEALIDWFNPANNYDQVVSLAADEAGGQGFVTEFAGATDGFEQTILMDWERQTWENFSSQSFATALDMYRDASQNFGGWDGFDDALAAAVTLPEDVDFEDFKLCFLCYANDAGFVFDQSKFLQELFEKVYKPVLDTQKLLDSRPYMTRLYTTMSADEMTLDPIFDFNPDLEDVSNLHVADRVIKCEDQVLPNNMQPWTVTLEQGDVVMGTQFGVWPVEIESMPAALQILQFGTSGQGRMVEDNSDMVSQMMDDVNSGTMGDDTPRGVGDQADDGAIDGPSGDGNSDGDADPLADMRGDDVGDGAKSSSGGCSVSSRDGASDLLAVLAALGLLGVRRRRQRRPVRRA